LLIFEFSEVTNPITCGAALNACDKGSQWQVGLVFWLRWGNAWDVTGG